MFSAFNKKVPNNNSLEINSTKDSQPFIQATLSALYFCSKYIKYDQTKCYE